VSLPGVRDVTERVLPIALKSRLAIGATYRTMVSDGTSAASDLVARIVEHRNTLVTAAREATKAVVRGGLSPNALHRRRSPCTASVVAVWGDRDRIVPMAHVAGVTTAFPHADTRVWAGMGHHHQHERPAELAMLVEEAFDRLEAPRLALAA
jgi:pimeloyl-ACP methyl ester carboxylesterase